MTTLITDPNLEQTIRARRAESRGDRFDEVWEGTYIMNPIPNPEHMHLQGQLVRAISDALADGPALVYPGVNVSDRDDGWTDNYRCPDVVVVLPGSAAREREAHYVGGPDFVVEIVSPYDKSREKISFYEDLGVRELLLIDRNPWGLELYRLEGGRLELAGGSKLDRPEALPSHVLPLSLRLVRGERRAQIEMRHTDGVRLWLA